MSKHPHFITESAYWREMRAIAKAAKAHVRKEARLDRFPRAVEHMEALINDHAWVNSPQTGALVLFYSAHSDQIFDDFGPQQFETYDDAMKELSGYAMRKDAIHTLESIMPEE